MKDEEVERHLRHIRSLPPELGHTGWWARTPEHVRERVAINTVIHNQGPKLEVVETEECKKEKQRICERR